MAYRLCVCVNECVCACVCACVCLGVGGGAPFHAVGSTYRTDLCFPCPLRSPPPLYQAARLGDVGRIEYTHNCRVLVHPPTDPEGWYHVEVVAQNRESARFALTEVLHRAAALQSLAPFEGCHLCVLEPCRHGRQRAIQ
jgi:hypothetical protein